MFSQIYFHFLLNLLAVCITRCLAIDQKQLNIIYWEWYQISIVGLLKFPYMHGLHYMVTICVFLLFLKICTRRVFSLENMYACGHCSHMSFTNPMPITVLYLNHISVGKKSNDTCLVLKSNQHMSMVSHTGLVRLIGVWWFCLYRY